MKFHLTKVLPYALVLSMALSGCGEKSDCEIPTRHVHKYTKQVTDEITIQKYLDNEHLAVHGYSWNSDYVEITKNDEELYKLFTHNGLFDGVTNWDYLYYVMAQQHDYLEFYYEYWTTETYTTTDSDGKVHTHTRQVHHDGWHTNAYDSDNTGRTRLNHHRYVGYCIVYQNGKYKVQKSNAVDDIRDVIYDYPYFTESPSVIVSKEFRFNKSELSSLSPSDFDTFTGPDLSTSELNTSRTRG